MVQSFDRLPVVDVAALRDADADARRVAAMELGRVARECGFFYVTGHGVPAERIERLIAQAKAFFALPMDEKMRSYIGLSQHHKGYVPAGEEVFYGGTKDSKEGFDLGRDLPATHPDVLAGTPMLGPNVWPDLAGFREDVNAYYEAATELGRALFRGFAVALGLEEDYFARYILNPPSQLRLLHYPFNPDAEDVLGIGAHTDYECFTILLPTAPGLEVLNGDGKWIDAPPVEGAFVVNIGDLLETWTNGEFVATSHRVRKVKEERYSFPLFCTCDFHTVVEPLAEFVKPSRYPPVKAGEHLFAQTAQSFTYLKQRIASGELVLPDGAHELSSFGQEARHRDLDTPDWLLGPFSRRSITFATGVEDRDTTVIWLQARGLCADFRYPAQRVRRQGRNSFDEFTDEELIELLSYEGGLARTKWDGARMSWVDWIAFQPHDRWPESGELRRVGDCVIEFAPSGAYVEDWRVLNSAAGPLDGMRDDASGWVICGDHAALVRRKAPLKDRTDRATIIEALESFEASYGKRSAPGAPYIVEFSTNPLREGEPLFETEPLSGGAMDFKKTTECTPEASAWMLREKLG